ncbi:ABC transporter substrate-binding protein [Caballeronia concitans]|uniref:Periplasmic binding protein/LacI transcriptional regulator n=1 Tax=Caballeronia concitans TaxID=1777133 RepID=A0A658QZN3_9BURK|nr:ABC transporter substrate-binding protein [Caballeronia concitans]KIG10687.1 Periplasmic binding protein domain containing protein [Burkholderia sp. MR1]SAL35695.1 periplasmic binding protein/LacI transcriptional regulator [Caballeronia concitans]
MLSLKNHSRSGLRPLSAALAAVATLTLSAGFSAAHAADDALPKIPNKKPLKVGFAQTESNNPWRLAETKSFKDIAAKCGWQMVMTDANSSAAKQVSDIQSMIAQRVDLLVFPPREEKPLAPVVMQAKKAGIPVILVDRNIDQSMAKAGRDYITFIGSDFIDQGHRAADWLVKATNGKATIIELEGSTGASAANDRKKGFDEVIAKNPGMKIVASQSGDFARDKGRQVMETLLQAHPDVTAVYAHNDEMALGAIAAIKAAGKQPGKDIQIVTIDGTKGGLEAIKAGELGASVQSSPFFGPLACDVAQKYAKGETIPPWVKVSDRFYDKSNVDQSMQYGY